MFVGLWIAKHSVLSAVKCDRATVLQQIAFQGFEVTERALGYHKPQFYQRTGRVVDEDEQGAGIVPILEPPMIRPVDLDLFTEAFPAQSGLKERASLFAGWPNPILDHPLANSLTRNLQPVMFSQHFRSHCRPEIRAIIFDEAQSVIALGFVDAVVRRFAAPS